MIFASMSKSHLVLRPRDVIGCDHNDSKGLPVYVKFNLYNVSLKFKKNYQGATSAQNRVLSSIFDNAIKNNSHQP